MKYKAILRPSFKKCLFSPLHTISVGREFFLRVPENTNSDLNAVANSADPDGNIHKEQSCQGQYCLPSFTGQPKLNLCCCCCCYFALNGPLRQYVSRYGKRKIMGCRNNLHPHLLQAQCGPAIIQNSRTSRH